MSTSATAAAADAFASACTPVESAPLYALTFNTSRALHCRVQRSNERHRRTGSVARGGPLTRGGGRAASSCNLVDNGTSDSKSFSGVLDFGGVARQRSPLASSQHSQSGGGLQPSTTSTQALYQSIEYRMYRVGPSVACAPMPLPPPQAFLPTTPPSKCAARSAVEILSGLLLSLFPGKNCSASAIALTVQLVRNYCNY